MLDAITKKRIDDCRDILVGKLPDPKAQIEQITIGLIYKFMDDMDKDAIKLGGKAKFFADYIVPDPENLKQNKRVPFSQYSWDNLFNTKVTAGEMLRLYSEALVSLETNPNIPPLFRDIFKNAFLPYRDPETLKLFLKTIDGFEYTHSEKLGDAFEYLLSVMGSQGDAGQFRTPRHIIDFIVAIVNPGKTDKILDPACGTAGFLISAFKHIKEKNKKGFTPDERKKLMENFVGYDISPDMVRLSLVNFYLHGFSDPHIWEYDTLSSEERWDETFDIILGNPPFMSPKGGIRPHKKFSISSNRSEVLFVDYIAEHLNSKGKAGIIVPEGVIFQSGGAYKDLRKMLVNNYLYAVVSLPAGVFNPYSGVKTSILLMDKDVAKKSHDILFVKIDNDGFGLGAQRNAVKGGQLQEAIELLQNFKDGNFSKHQMAHAISKEEIARNGDYNLSGERYKLGIELSSQYELVQLQHIVVMMHQGINTAADNVEFEDEGYPIIQARNMTSENIEFSNLKYLSKTDWNRYKDKHKPNVGDILFSNIGTIGKSVVVDKELDYLIHWNIFKIVVNQEKILPNFLKQCLGYLTSINYWDQFQKGGTVKFVNKKILNEILIPLPPLAIQEEIVAEIDGYQKIIDGAKAILRNYKPKIDINPDWEIVELGEVCEVKSGGTPSRDEKSYWNGDIPWVGSTVCKDDFVNSAEEFITKQGLNKSSAKIFQAGTTLIALVGATIGKTGFLNFDCATNQNIAGLYPKNLSRLNEKYLFYAIQLLYRNFMRLGEGKFRMATLSFVKEQKISLPPIETQRKIVAQIEREQELVNANKQLIELFQQKMKDRIEKAWGNDKKKAPVYVGNEVMTLSGEN
jgi:type I restriction enzyme M protein